MPELVRCEGARLLRRVAATMLAVVLVVSAAMSSAAQERGDPAAGSAGLTWSEEHVVFVRGEKYEPSGVGGVLASSCQSSDSNQRIIYTYERARPENGSGMAAGVSRMRCGSTGWGLRHIDINHSSQWATIAARVGGEWEDFMSWVVRQVLAAPSSATYRPANDTWGYTAPLEIRDGNGNVVGRYRPLVSVAADSKNIITAFPRGA